ncbi:MAG: UbiA family prenyltransferase [Acidobacteriota bacterium]
MIREISWADGGTRRQSARPWSVTFWRAFWTTMRPYLIFVSGAAALTGMAFIPESDTAALIVGFIPLLFSYGLGQALTDCFQMDTDSLSSPYRPLVRGIVSRRQVLTVSLGGLAAGVMILAILNPEIVLLGIPAVAGLLSYTRLKRTWWGGPPWNSWIVALLPLMGRLSGGDVGLAELLSPQSLYSAAFYPAVLAIFFGYANFVLMGYFKDISADRATGYRTLPVVFGWRAGALASDFHALAAAALTGVCVAALPDFFFLGRLTWTIGIVVNLRAQVGIHRMRDERLAYGPIADVVRSFILYSTAITLSLKPGWLPFMAGFYLLFETALKMRPEQKQV